MSSSLFKAVKQPGTTAVVPKRQHAPALPTQRSPKPILRASNGDASPASELQALVCELAGFESGACQALLHEAECVQVVKALASGANDNISSQYEGCPQVRPAAAVAQETRCCDQHNCLQKFADRCCMLH